MWFYYLSKLTHTLALDMQFDLENVFFSVTVHEIYWSSLISLARISISLYCSASEVYQITRLMS